MTKVITRQAPPLQDDVGIGARSADQTYRAAALNSRHSGSAPVRIGGYALACATRRAATHLFAFRRHCCTPARIPLVTARP